MFSATHVLLLVCVLRPSTTFFSSSRFYKQQPRDVTQHSMTSRRIWCLGTCLLGLGEFVEEVVALLGELDVVAVDLVGALHHHLELLCNSETNAH